MLSVNTYNFSKSSSLLPHVCKENWISNFIDQEALFQNNKSPLPSLGAIYKGVLTQGWGQNGHIVYIKTLFSLLLLMLNKKLTVY